MEAVLETFSEDAQHRELEKKIVCNLQFMSGWKWRNYRILVEGGIGYGKTRCIERFGDAVHCIDEPMGEINRLLREQYTNAKGVAYTVQLLILLHYTDIAMKAHEMDPALNLMIVRHPLSVEHVFGKIQHERGNIAEDDWERLLRLCRAVCNLDFYGDAHNCATMATYADPLEAYNRVQSRGQPGDAEIDLVYLMRIGDLYETYMKALDAFFRSK